MLALEVRLVVLQGAQHFVGDVVTTIAAAIAAGQVEQRWARSMTM